MGGQGGEEKTQEIEVDQETVERTLIQIFSLSDDTHQNPPTLPAQTIFDVLHSNDVQMQSCQLSELEVCGLAAEMILDDNGNVAYVDHVKRWVPTVFELRKHELLGAYLQDTLLESLGIPEPTECYREDLVPVILKDEVVEVKVRRSSRQLTRMQSVETPTRFRSCIISGTGSIMGDEERLVRRGSKERGSSKEPPPGRGLQRRKTCMANTSINKNLI